MEKILVVNNDFDTMELLKSWLERKKYKVKYTGNGDDVTQIVKDFNPDVIIVDVLQEKVAKNLKATEKTKNIPIILMTGYTILNRDFSMDNADDIIEKPFDPQILERKIKNVLKKAA